MGRGCWQRLLRVGCNCFAWRAILSMLAVWGLTLIWGCAQSPALRQRVDFFINSQWGASAPSAVQSDRLSFKEAFQLAVQHDEQILQTLSQADAAVLDTEQAESQLWPRFDIQGSGQIPIGGDTDSDDSHLRGGLFMRYDFHKALFRSDAASAARATQRRQLDHANGLMLDLAYKLFDQLARIGQLEQEVRLRQAMADKARQGAQTAQKMCDFQMAAPPLAWQWQSAAQTHRQQLNQARAELVKARRSLGFLLGLNEGQAVAITDYQDIAISLDQPLTVSLDDPRILQSVWQRRFDTRMAEIDLFLAEMGILEAKRKRVPSLSGSIGVGSFDVQEDEDEEAPAAVELSVSMPLFDWGDIRRAVQKAERHREWAQQHIRLLIRRLQHDLQENVGNLQDSQEAWQQASSTWQAMRNQGQTNQRLLELKQIQPLDALNFELETDAAEIAVHQRQVELLHSRAALKKTLGLALVESLPPDAASALEPESAARSGP